MGTKLLDPCLQILEEIPKLSVSLAAYVNARTTRSASLKCCAIPEEEPCYVCKYEAGIRTTASCVDNCVQRLK